MTQNSQRNDHYVLRITILDEKEFKLLEWVPATRKNLATVELTEQGKALGELLSRILPKDTLHALRAYLV